MKSLSPLGLNGYSITTSGDVYSAKSARFLKSSTQSSGYMTVSLKGKTHFVHRLVMLTYAPTDGCENLQVNHKDGVKSNNTLKNLEWCTPKENSIHSVREGLNPLRSADEDVIHLICRHLEDGWRVRDVASLLDVTPHYVSQIKGGFTAVYISQEYEFNHRRNVVISPESVLRVCKLLQDGCSGASISHLTGVNVQTVRNIKARRVHKHISRAFKW